MLLYLEELYRIEKSLQLGAFFLKFQLLNQDLAINDSLKYLIFVRKELVWWLFHLLVDNFHDLNES